jgi:hypothetical protein
MVGRAENRVPRRVAVGRASGRWARTTAEKRLCRAAPARLSAPFAAGPSPHLCESSHELQPAEIAQIRLAFV